MKYCPSKHPRSGRGNVVHLRRLAVWLIQAAVLINGLTVGPGSGGRPGGLTIRIECTVRVGFGG